MKIIQKLSDYIEDELCDAKKYATEAVKCKTEYPELSKLFYDLSGEEMGHMERLHKAVVGMIEKYRREHGEPPENMMAVYDYLHEKQIEKATEVRMIQDMYR